MRTPPNETAERLKHTPERTCVLTRRKATKDALIRLALGPDGTVAPDVRARAPGRGAWISVGRAELDEAVANGKLKAALARASLDRLGMEARAGNLLSGSERVEATARSGKVHLLIHAADAGEDGRKRLDQAWRAGGGGPQGVIFPEPRPILSIALGRENVVHVALNEPAAAARVMDALSRWRDFIAPDAGLEGGAPASRTGTAEEVEGTE